MAARLRAYHQQEIRDKIRASQLVNFLQDHALNGKGGENASTRVRAALGLLNKVVPDLSAVAYTGTPSVTSAMADSVLASLVIRVLSAKGFRLDDARTVAGELLGVEIEKEEVKS